MTEVRLVCRNAESAARVVSEHMYYYGAGPSNTIRQDGNEAVIGYFDKRWPLDIAEWAHENGYASDGEAARVIAQL